MKKIKKIGIYQTSKVSAVIYFIISGIFLIPFGIISHTIGDNNTEAFTIGGSYIFFTFPFLYAIIGFIMTAIGCFVYNLTVRWTGGIELEFETSDKSY
jgi:energy-converting hydrogenase Eha subunit E